MKQKIVVWDPLVRIFHWSLVTFFLISYLSGDEWDEIHVYSGYVILGLLATRILWGFIGTRYARFSSFVTSPEKTMSYLKSLLSSRPEHYVGHNPAGGWMVLALLLSLSLTGVTGYIMEEGDIFTDPVVTEGAVGHIEDGHDEDEDERHGHDEHESDEHELLEEVHEFFANLSLFLVIIHIIGVFVASRLHGENLVQAMITGYKDKDQDE